MIVICPDGLVPTDVSPIASQKHNCDLVSQYEEKDLKMPTKTDMKMAAYHDKRLVLPDGVNYLWIKIWNSTRKVFLAC